MKQPCKSKNGSLRGNRTDIENTSLSWKNINVYLTKKSFYNCIRFRRSTTETRLITDASGEVKYGRILAIMGSSGSGKTTLLNVLSGRNVADCRVEGMLAISGQETHRKSIKSLSAIVQQDDIFLCNLTVREHIYYQALLRMSEKHSMKQITDRITEIINELELTQCMDLYIGSIRRKGISGGEKKRLSLASEMLSSPSILFLDEPTSGLDLHVAEKIVTLLRNLSAAQKTIICTIHQPSFAIFRQFDDLLLLSEGRVAFMGKASDALFFFEQQGCKVPLDLNPADFYIQSIAIDSNDIDNSHKRVKNICDAFQLSHFKKKVEIDNSSPLLVGRKYRSSFWIQFNVCLKRTWNNSWRENMYFIILVQEFICAIIFGFVFCGLPPNQTGIKNTNGAILYIIVVLSFQLCLIELRRFYEELPLYQRELDSGLFSTTASFWGYNVAHTPYQIIVALIFSVPFYAIVGFGGGLTRFMNYTITCLLFCQTVMSFAYIVRSCLFPLILSLKLTSSFLRVMFLLSGTMIDYSTLPKYMSYVKRFSFSYLANEAFVINQWHKVHNISCEVLRITSKTATTKKLSLSQCLNNGTEVIESLSYDPNNFEMNNVKLLFSLIFFSVIANIFLCLRMKRL